MLRCDFYITERNTHDLNEEKQNNNFLPNLIKISTDLFKTEYFYYKSKRFILCELFFILLSF